MKKSSAKTCYRFFSVLRNPIRLAILELLLDNGPLNVAEISAALGVERSKISHHLGILLNCRFVFVERNWRNRIYSVNKETVESIFRSLKLHLEKFGLEKD